MKPFIAFGLPIILAILNTGCSNSSNQQHQSSKESTSIDMTNVTVVTPTIVNGDAAVMAQVQDIYIDYLEIQSALASDKFKESAIAANRLQALMNNFNDGAVPDNQRRIYESHSAAIKDGTMKIINSKQIEQQRLAFEPLSGQVFELLKSFGSTKPVYQTHCPMAFDNKGASWLSDTTLIRNPYFGDKMLECGEIVSVVKK